MVPLPLPTAFASVQQTARKSTGGQNIVKKLASQKGLKQRRAQAEKKAALRRPAATEKPARRPRKTLRGTKALRYGTFGVSKYHAP